MSPVDGGVSGRSEHASVKVFRGEFLESEHRAIVAVSDADGKILFKAGDVSFRAAMRSSAKPFQLVPLVESGAADRFGFTASELAVMAGSHAGRPEHVRTVRSILEKAGLSESHLQCGTHLPFDSRAADDLVGAKQSATPLHNNCSGKHAAMLALSSHLKAPLDNYLSLSHPVQTAIRDVVAWAAGCDVESLRYATDGCSAPTFFVPVDGAARAFARLAKADRGSPREVAMKRIREAMTASPDLVSGPGRFDTVAMKELTGLCAKGGAEGYQGLAWRPSTGSPMGVAVKILDGAGRAAGPLALEILRSMIGTLPAPMEALRSPVIKNHRGTDVGRIVPVLSA